MTSRLSYMGTKQWLAAEVASIVEGLPPGGLLDAFSGMCAVGHRIAPYRPVWTNDIQIFPAIFAQVTLCNSNEGIDSSAWSLFHAAFNQNKQALERRFRSDLSLEETYLESERWEDVRRGNQQLYTGNSKKLERERQKLALNPKVFPYRLATITYAGCFFGTRQCIEIDSIRYAIDRIRTKTLITEAQKNRLLVALGFAAARANNSTGHFANFLTPSKSNFLRVLPKRRRSIYREFMLGLCDLQQAAPRRMTLKNRAFNSETNALLEALPSIPTKPKIIFADPPYTEVQYSRYYHVLDTLIHYNYPDATGVGRYPGGRFQTPFAHVRHVVPSLQKLIQGSANAGAILLMSYPENGLLARHQISVTDLLRRMYKKTSVLSTRETLHSTMGSKFAPPTQAVHESIYLAWNPST